MLLCDFVPSPLVLSQPQFPFFLLATESTQYCTKYYVTCARFTVRWAVKCDIECTSVGVAHVHPIMCSNHSSSCEMVILRLCNFHGNSTVRVQKNDADIRNAFPNCVCGAAPTANWKASSANRKTSSRNRRFLPKKRKASFEQRWVWKHINFRNAVQLHLRIFRGCICVFRSCVCVFQAALIMEKQNSNGKVSANTRHF